jgi:hypothetical protein
MLFPQRATGRSSGEETLVAAPSLRSGCGQEITSVGTRSNPAGPSRSLCAGDRDGAHHHSSCSAHFSTPSCRPLPGPVKHLLAVGPFALPFCCWRSPRERAPLPVQPRRRAGAGAEPGGGSSARGHPSGRAGGNVCAGRMPRPCAVEIHALRLPWGTGLPWDATALCRGAVTLALPRRRPHREDPAGRARPPCRCQA